MRNDIQGVRVRVPATAANLGPGFDVLGLALSLYNTFTITPADQVTIEVLGQTSTLPRDASNLFYKAFSFLYQHSGTSPIPVRVEMDLAIPSGSGLGSSATAVVGGLVAANVMLGGKLTKDDLVPFAIQLEHGTHADNVAPALLGGLVINAHDPSTNQTISLQVPFPDDLVAVLLIPQFEMDTVKGRALMPSHYPKSDLVFSTSRVALFISALQTHRYDLLKVAMQDKIHQPYRTQVFSAMPTLIAAALDAGAYGASLSGGGSSILAFVGKDAAQAVGEALLQSANVANLDGVIRIL
ncbi:MAG: homoserine kinase, partial [Chloroflexia bacterium]